MKYFQKALVLFLIFAGSFAGLLLWLFQDFPHVDNIDEKRLIGSVRITDRHGQLLYEIISETGGRYTELPLEAIPLYLQQATIATEDANFYTNPGVDFAGIIRALWINIRGGEILAGGSTITQQVVRNLLFNADERFERSVRRKIRESLLAWLLSQQYSKEQILGMYLNQMYYGGLSYGVEAAAQTYFGRSVHELDLAECALLAGLPQAPVAYNPITNPQAAKNRQQIVLELMHQHGFINDQERAQAENEPLIYSEVPFPIEAPHFVMFVRAQVDRLFPPNEVITLLQSSNGLTIRTSLDLALQHQAENIINQQLINVRNDDEGLGHNMNSAALVALDPRSGELLSMVGSPDYFNPSISGAVNMAITPRQPGSAIKPILYAIALDPNQSDAWTAATILLDVRTSFLTSDGKAYTPSNYDGKEHGPVTLRQSLASSLNIPAVITLDHFGLQALVTLATKMGITTLDDPARYDLSLALGGGGVTLLDLTRAYAVFSNGGFRLDPVIILDIKDIEGKVLYQASSLQSTRLIDERVAWLITDILSDDEARMLGFGRNSILQLDRPAAVKTGTTTNFHDNWTIGYTPNLVVGVWAGNSDYQPMREVTGVTGAAPIWHQFMRTALTNITEEQFSRPPGLIEQEICSPVRQSFIEGCPYRLNEWFIEGTQPDSIAVDASPDIFRIVSPANNSIFRIAASNLNNQRLHIQSSSFPGLLNVTIWIDGFPIASNLAPPYETWWIIEEGDHEIWVTAERQDGTIIQSEPIRIQVIQK